MAPIKVPKLTLLRSFFCEAALHQRLAARAQLLDGLARQRDVGGVAFEQDGEELPLRLEVLEDRADELAQRSWR
jgi:hypothetical protein